MLWRVMHAGEGLQWVVGDAERLPFPDASMDAYTIAFGIRNVTRIEAALAEAHRARASTPFPLGSVTWSLDMHKAAFGCMVPRVGCLHAPCHACTSKVSLMA